MSFHNRYKIHPWFWKFNTGLDVHWSLGTLMLWLVLLASRRCNHPCWPSLRLNLRFWWCWGGSLSCLAQTFWFVPWVPELPDALCNWDGWVCRLKVIWWTRKSFWCNVCTACKPGRWRRVRRWWCSWLRHSLFLPIVQFTLPKNLGFASYLLWQRWSLVFWVWWVHPQIRLGLLWERVVECPSSRRDV